MRRKVFAGTVGKPGTTPRKGHGKDGKGKAKRKGKGKDTDGPAPSQSPSRSRSQSPVQKLLATPGRWRSLRDHCLFAAKSGDPGKFEY